MNFELEQPIHGNIPNIIQFVPVQDSFITTKNTLFMSTTTPNTLKYTDSIGTLHTIEIPTMVVDSLNGLTGALSITTPNSTLTITNSSPDIELDINLANANTWSALQTFGNNISIGGAQFNITSLTAGQYLYYNGTNWINVIPITGTTLTEISGQLALNLANANTWTATQTFPTNSIPVSATELAVNTTLTLSTNTLSINLANANTWTALQTFGNNISIGGAQFSIATLTVGNFLYYNGTNWINQSLASGSGISISDYTISNSGVLSLNSLTGALDITTPNSTLNITNSSPNIELDINLANANTWTALQTFGNNISIGGAQFSIATLTVGNFLYYNGTNWINQSLASGSGISISDYTISNTGVLSLNSLTGALDITTPNSTLTITNSSPDIELDINLAHANTWTALQTFSGNTLGNNYQINGGYRFWGKDTNGVVMFYGADSYSSYGNQIMDFGVNVTQQANSGGLPSPTATYGGGLFRYDLRTGNPSTLVSLAAATGNAEFYILLQPSGTTGGGNPIFGCSANGIVGTIHNTLDNSLGDIILNPNASTSTTKTENSGYIDLLGSYWNGSASVPYGFRVQSDITATTPAGQLNFNLNNNGTITTLMNISQSGSLNLFTSQTTITGTTAGSIIASQLFQGSSYKKVVIYLSGYENDTATAQTYTYDTAFTNTPVISANNSGLTPIVSTTSISFNPDNTTVYTGFIILEGY